jgi:hypothetical protein
VFCGLLFVSIMRRAAWDSWRSHWIRNVTLTEAATLIWPTERVSPAKSDGPPSF